MWWKKDFWNAEDSAGGDIKKGFVKFGRTNKDIEILK
jgi:hypothetical protein